MNKSELSNYYIDILASNNIKSFQIKEWHDDEDIDLVILNAKISKIRQIFDQQDGLTEFKNLSQKRERDKYFFAINDSPYHLHIHEEISWNTDIVLDKNTIYERYVSNQKNLTIEDQYLIAIGHSYFENYYIEPTDFAIIKRTINKTIDTDYIEKQISTFNWKNGFNYVVSQVKQNRHYINPIMALPQQLIRAFLHILKDKPTMFLTRLFNIFFCSYIWVARRKYLKLRIITLSGVDGSGKTTNAKYIKKLLEDYGYNVKYGHIGHNPISPSSIKPNHTLWFLPVIKDFLMTWFEIITSKLFYDVLILDRSMIDTKVKIQYRYRKNIPSWMNITNTISIMLLPPPIISYERDNDHNEIYHEKKHTLYTNLIAGNKTLVVTDTNLEDIQKQINEFLTKLNIL